MLGVACGGLSQSVYNHAQLWELAYMAFDKKSEDTAEKKFWWHSLVLYMSKSSQPALSQLRDMYTETITEYKHSQKIDYLNILSMHKERDGGILLIDPGECTCTTTYHLLQIDQCRYPRHCL